MKNNKAIVTIILGKHYEDFWKAYAYPSWKNYAEKHGYDIIALNKALDSSERAVKRSPSWQKCLLVNLEEIQQYEQVVWIDSDIIINHFTAPCIISQVAKEKVGAIDAWNFRSTENFKLIHMRSKAYEIKHRLPSYNIGSEYYQDYGLPPISEKALQCGVLVLNPKVHKEIFNSVYYNYEDGRSANWHYEMRPLSYEIIQNDLVQWIDFRFNYVVENLKAELYFHKYPRSFHERVLRILKIKTFLITNKIGIRNWQEEMVNKAYLEGYFIHFAGNSKEMIFCKNLLAL